MRRKSSILTIGFLSAWLLLLAACSSTRHVPDGKYLLDDVKLEIHDSTETFNRTEMLAYVRQRPNNSILHVAKLRLGFYNMSGNDSTKWWNKWARKLGEAPVIYDSLAALSDARQLEKAMNNAGFLSARVEIDSFPRPEKKKIKLKYTLEPGRPHTIRSVSYVFPNDTLRDLIMSDSDRFEVRPGRRLDRAILDSQRERIVRRLRNRGDRKSVV